MRPINPVALLAFGLVLILLGFALPFAMMLRVLDPSFALSFLSFGASVSGLFLGLIGTALYVRLNRRE
jgi:purine-cytosine permease-like protein